jgi:hypothetical protein
MTIAERSVMPSSLLSTKANCGRIAKRQIPRNNKDKNGRRSRLIPSRVKIALDVRAIVGTRGNDRSLQLRNYYVCDPRHTYAFPDVSDTLWHLLRLGLGKLNKLLRVGRGS